MTKRKKEAYKIGFYKELQSTKDNIKLFSESINMVSIDK